MQAAVLQILWADMQNALAGRQLVVILRQLPALHSRQHSSWDQP